MAIKILYVDLRVSPSRFTKYLLDWRSGLTAQSAVQYALGESIAGQLVDDLLNDNKELIVSWTNSVTGEHSDVGGINSLEWEIADNSILSIVYENEETTQQKIDESIEWMLRNEEP